MTPKPDPLVSFPDELDKREEYDAPNKQGGAAMTISNCALFGLALGFILGGFFSLFTIQQPSLYPAVLMISGGLICILTCIMTFKKKRRV